MKRRKVRAICTRMKKSRVAVIGDIMLDRYIWGQVDRISPEAPVPVVAVENTNVRPGGAANVAWNLISFGIDVALVGLVGKDPTAREIRSLMSKKDIPTAFLVSDSSRVTTEKIRIVAHNQQVVRADFESDYDIGKSSLTRLRAAVKRAIKGAGAVIVSDYGKGVVTEKVMDTVRDLCERDGIPVLVDPKEGHFSLYRGAYAITPNKMEAGGFYNKKIKTDEDLADVGESLIRDLAAKAVLITRGEEGMTLFRKGKASRHFPTRASEVYDVTGAGDTVISVLAASLAAGAEIFDAIELANAAAGVVVRELGTASVSPGELQAEFPV